MHIERDVIRTCGVAIVAAALAACSSGTSLTDTSGNDTVVRDASPDVTVKNDAGHGTADSGIDATSDAMADAGSDAMSDAGSDAPADGASDALADGSPTDGSDGAVIDGSHAESGPGDGASEAGDGAPSSDGSTDATLTDGSTDDAAAADDATSAGD